MARKQMVIRDSIEDAIDEVGIMNFLIYLEEICHEKAAHVRETRQDEVLALKWERTCSKVLSANDPDLEGV